MISRIFCGSLMRHTAILADVRGHLFQRHHRARPCLLGDASLLRVTTSMITPPLSI